MIKLPTEVYEQIKFVQWCKKNGIRPEVSSNGGYRNPREAVKFKRMGVEPGVPDIRLAYPRKGYGALYIEMKRVKGPGLTEAQKEYIDFLNKNGNLAVMCRGADKAIEVVKEYFSD